MRTPEARAAEREDIRRCLEEKLAEGAWRDIEDWLVALAEMVEDGKAVIREIPACRVHGNECSAHAREWIHEQRAKALGLWDEGETTRPMSRTL